MIQRRKKAQIGIIGGSGFYQFLKGKEIAVSTPYGKTSDKILISNYLGKVIAFLPRHGKNHQLPPHQIPYRANIWALYQLGVERIIAPCSVGSLRPEIKPGHFLFSDDFIDFTKRRVNTFYDGKSGKISKKVVHLSSVNPFCPQMRHIAIKSSQELKIPFYKKGTILVIEGPRFSTKKESEFFKKSGGDVINMTAFPELILARELGMCYLNISLVTDYDAGLKGRKDIKPVTTKQILEIFTNNNEKVKKLILQIIKNLPPQKNCSCANALKEAVVA